MRSASSIPACSCTTRRTCRRRPAAPTSRTSTATPASCATAGTRSSSSPSTRRTSRWPTSCSTASCRTSSSWSSGPTTSRTTRSSTRTCASGSSTGSTTTPTRWACSCPRWPRSARSTPRPRTSRTSRARDKQILRLLAKSPTLAAMCYRFSVGLPFFLPDNSLSYPANFLTMMWKIGEYELHPALERAMDVLFILHADHEQNCGTDGDARRRLQPGRPVLGGRGRGLGALRPAPRRRQRAGRADAHRDRLDRERPGVRRVPSRPARAG